MVRIRLRRVGAKRQPSYRIVVADRERPRDGRFIEVIGHYNPRTEPATIEVDEARVFHWMSHGAQPSDSVVRLLRTNGCLERWERLRKGEPLEELLQEARAAASAPDARTRRDDVERKGLSRRAKAAAAAAEAPTPEAAAPDAAAEGAESAA